MEIASCVSRIMAFAASTSHPMNLQGELICPRRREQRQSLNLKHRDVLLQALSRQHRANLRIDKKGGLVAEPSRAEHRICHLLTNIVGSLNGQLCVSALDLLGKKSMSCVELRVPSNIVLTTPPTMMVSSFSR